MVAESRHLLTAWLVVLLFLSFLFFPSSFLFFLLRSSPNLLSKADIAKIYISVKDGGGRGLNENQINNQEFKTCLVLLAMCGTRACQVLPPKVHTIAESRSTSRDATQYIARQDQIPCVDKLKWLLRRIFNSPIARESKARHLVKFRAQFADMLNADGNPLSYLRPYVFDDSTSQRSSRGEFSERSVSAIPQRRLSLAPHANAHLNWIKLKDEKGRTYYFNRDTGNVTWEKPLVLGASNLSVHSNSDSNSRSALRVPAFIPNGGAVDEMLFTTTQQEAYTRGSIAMASKSFSAIQRAIQEDTKHETSEPSPWENSADTEKSGPSPWEVDHSKGNAGRSMRRPSMITPNFQSEL